MSILECPSWLFEWLRQTQWGVGVQLIDPYHFVQATIIDMQWNMFAKVVWWGLVVCALACFIVGMPVAILIWAGRSGVHLKGPSYEL